MTDLYRDRGVLGFWDPRRMFLFGVCVFLQTQNPMMGDTHKKSCTGMIGAKGKYIGACLEQRRHFMLIFFSVDTVMGEEMNESTKQLALSCRPNGTGNTQQHTGMPSPLYP